MCDDSNNEWKSRTEIKHEVQQLQKLGEQLVKLSERQLAAIEMPEKLRVAVLDAKRFTSHEALRRQMQFIGRLMFENDTFGVEEAMEKISRGLKTANAKFHELEALRDRLVERGDNQISIIKKRFDGADVQRIRQLVRNSKKELKENKAPKSSRALFRYLRELQEKLAGGEE